MKQIFSIVVLALICLQANSHIINYSPYSYDPSVPLTEIEQRAIVDELIKQAQAALEGLKKIITDNLSAPIKDITDLQARLQAISNEAIAFLKKLYLDEEEKIIGDVRTMITCYQNEAEKLGINIKDCISQSQDRILSLPDGFLKNITTCATNEYDKAMELVNQAINIYDTVMNDLKAFPDKISNCASKGWWDMSTCFIGLGKDIAELALKIPTTYAKQLVELSTKLSVYVAGMKIRIEACGAMQTTVLAANAMGISKDFIGCVKDKFPNPVQCLSA